MGRRTQSECQTCVGEIVFPRSLLDEWFFHVPLPMGFHRVSRGCCQTRVERPNVSSRKVSCQKTPKNDFKGHSCPRQTLLGLLSSLKTNDAGTSRLLSVPLAKSECDGCPRPRRRRVLKTVDDSDTFFLGSTQGHDMQTKYCRVWH